MHVVPVVHQANDRSFAFDDRAAAVESVFAEYDGGTTSDDQNLGSSRDII